MRLLNIVRRWLYRFKLRLLYLEMDDTSDDMADALADQNFGVYRALAEFQAELLVEIDTIRRKLAALH